MLAVTVIVVNVEGVVPAYRLEGAARELGATAAEVQANAAVTGKIHGLVYDLSAGEYWILAPPEAPEGADSEAAAADEEKKAETDALVPLPPFRLHKNLRFKDLSLGGKRTRMRGRVRILFHPDGSGPPHAVHLVDAEGKEYTVEINPFAQSVEFFEGRRDFDAFLEGE